MNDNYHKAMILVLIIREPSAQYFLLEMQELLFL